MARSFKDPLEFDIRHGGGHVFQNEVAGAEKAVEWCAELVRDEIQELVLGTIEDGQPLVGVGKFNRARRYSLFQAFIVQLQRTLEIVKFEMRFDPRVNFVELEGLGYVVYSARPEGLHFVVGFG